MPGAPAFRSTRLSASAKVPAGQELLPQARLGGVRCGVARRRGWTALWTGAVGLHPPALPSRPLTGLAAINVHPTSTSVLPLGFAFGPSRRSSIPPVIRPLLTSPRRAATSRPPPSRTTPRTKHRTRHLGHPWRSPQVRPATFIAHPPRLRNGPLMDIRASPCRAGSPEPPRLIRAARRPTATSHVFLGSRLRLRLPSHPASRRRSCP